VYNIVYFNGDLMVRQFNSYLKDYEYLEENALFTTQQERDEFVKDENKVALALVFNFYGMLGLINATQPAQRSILMNYFKKDLKLRVNTITDDNNFWLKDEDGFDILFTSNGANVVFSDGGQTLDISYLATVLKKKMRRHSETAGDFFRFARRFAAIQMITPGAKLAAPDKDAEQEHRGYNHSLVPHSCLTLMLGVGNHTHHPHIILPHVGQVQP